MLLDLLQLVSEWQSYGKVKRSSGRRKLPFDNNYQATGSLGLPFDAVSLGVQVIVCLGDDFQEYLIEVPVVIVLQSRSKARRHTQTCPPMRSKALQSAQNCVFTNTGALPPHYFARPAMAWSTRCGERSQFVRFQSSSSGPRAVRPVQAGGTQKTYGPLPLQES